MTDLLTDEILNPVIIKLNDLLAYLLGIELLHASNYLTTSEFLDKQSGPLASIFTYGRIASPLKTEGGVGLESVPLGGLAY